MRDSYSPSTHLRGHVHKVVSGVLHDVVDEPRVWRQVTLGEVVGATGGIFNNLRPIKRVASQDLCHNVLLVVLNKQREVNDLQDTVERRRRRISRYQRVHNFPNL